MLHGYGRSAASALTVRASVGFASVVFAEVTAIVLVELLALVELRRVLDLVLGQVHEDLPVERVDGRDRARRQQRLVTEDPRAGRAHAEAAGCVAARFRQRTDL